MIKDNFKNMNPKKKLVTFNTFFYKNICLRNNNKKFLTLNRKRFL